MSERTPEENLDAALGRKSRFGFTRHFTPVVVRNRHDGWTTARQADFIAALGESGCVTAACARVGMSTESAYRLRGRFDAVDFRQAWEAALDYAVERLSDAALSRAINGVAVPHYYKGEVVGEHRRYDERLTQFILRYRAPLTYARHWDRMHVVAGHSEAAAERFAVGIDSVRADVSRGMFEEEELALREEAAEKAEGDARRHEHYRPQDTEEIAQRRAEAAEARAAYERYAAEVVAGRAAEAADILRAARAGRNVPPT